MEDYSAHQNALNRKIKARHRGKLKVSGQFKQKQVVKSLSRVRLFATLWTVAYQAPPSMGFSREECWRGLPFPSPGDLSDPGIEPRSPSLQADALSSEPPFVGVCVCVSFFKVFVVKHGHLRVCCPAKYRTTSYALFGQMMILSLQSTVHTLQ